jgi:hypothetical protein
LNGTAAAAAAAGVITTADGGMVRSPSWLRKGAASPSADSIPEDGHFEEDSADKGFGNSRGSSNNLLHNTEISPASPLGLAGAYDIVLRQQQQQSSSRNPYGSLSAAAAAFPAEDVSAADVTEQQQAGQQGDAAGLPSTGVYHQLSFGIWGQEVMRKVGSESSLRISFENSPRFDSRQQQQRRLQHQSSFGFGQLPGSSAGEVPGSNPGVSRSSSGSSDAAGKAKAAARGARQQWWQQALSNMVQSLQLFWTAVKQPHVLRPVMFLFLWQVRAAGVML